MNNLNTDVSENQTIANRIPVNRDQKAWKFIRDVTNTSLANLSKTAIEDGRRTYTYGLMFREWERYASVFSALGMTGEKHSRTGILGSTCAEVICSIYGLNMVGTDVSIVPAYSALMPKRIMETIRKEKLTDIIITDDFAQINLMHDLILNRDYLGLNNIIILHVPIAGVTVNKALSAAQESKYGYLKFWVGPICMDELLKAYDNYPVQYADETSSDTAFILHTSGTTSGAGKPVPLSDRAMNAAAATFYQMQDLKLPWENLVTAVIVDLSNAYGIVDQVHLPFAMGAEVVTNPGGVLNPWFCKAIPHHHITFLFTISAMFERWIKASEKLNLDFSSLRFAVLGGAAVSAADKHRYYRFMQEHGAGEVTLLNGYGISELGGACCLSTPDLDDEAIGYPLPDVNIRLYNEEQDRYLSPADAPCEGILYLNSPSLATPALNGESLFQLNEVEDLPYICTNDLVKVDQTGKLTFLGRAGRYFINDEGRKYEAGRVETEFARQDGIESCCVVPVYVKTTHDNIPMLCIKPIEGGEDGKTVILTAFRQIFITDKTLEPDQLPSRVLIAAELPRNGNGKIDLFKISRGEVEGETFTIQPVNRLNQLIDFHLVPYEEGRADMIKEVFDGISAELKNSLPLNTNKQQTKENNEMKNTKKVFESFNSMNRMGMQMMKNVMGRMGQMYGNNCTNDMPFNGMPDFTKMMDGMKQMNEKAAENMKSMNDKAFAGMNVMNQKMTEKLPEAQEAAQQMAQAMVPTMRQQMNQMIGCMRQMNAAALQMMQMSFEQNVKLMNQIMDSVEKMAGTAPAETPAAEAAAPEAPAAEAPKEAKKAEKKPGKKKAAKAAKE